MFVMKRLEHVAEQVKLGESKDARKQILHEKLNEIVLPATFKLPLNPHLTVSIEYLFLIEVVELIYERFTATVTRFLELRLRSVE